MLQLYIIVEIFWNISRLVARIEIEEYRRRPTLFTLVGYAPHNFLYFPHLANADREELFYIYILNMEILKLNFGEVIYFERSASKMSCI